MTFGDPWTLTGHINYLSFSSWFMTSCERLLPCVATPTWPGSILTLLQRGSHRPGGWRHIVVTRGRRGACSALRAPAVEMCTAMWRGFDDHRAADICELNPRLKLSHLLWVICLVDMVRHSWWADEWRWKRRYWYVVKNWWEGCTGL